MISPLRFVPFAIAAVAAVLTSALPSSASTALTVYNAANTPVYAIITVTADGQTPTINDIQVNGSASWVAPPTTTPPPPTDSGLYYTCPPSTTGCASTPIQGFFYLQNGATANITSTVGQNVLNGVSIAFLQPPYACPGASNGFYPFTPEFTAQNGTNFAEVSLNVTSGEFVDISCNNGANATITVTGTGGPNWQVGATPVVTPLSITNSWVNGTTGTDNNCQIAGVFPFQFTRCTTGPNDCSNSPDNQSCTSGPADNGPCEFSRLAGQTGGGTVQVSFIGALQPPLPVASPPPPGSTPPPGAMPPPGATPGQPITSFPFKVHPVNRSKHTRPNFVPN